MVNRLLVRIRSIGRLVVVLAAVSLLVYLAYALSGSRHESASTPTPPSDRPWAPREQVEPPTIQAYVEHIDLRSSMDFDFTHPRTKQQQRITSRETIAQVIDLLLSPDKSPDPRAGVPDKPFSLVFHLPAKYSSDGHVGMDYDPSSHAIALTTVPTSSWPVWVKGNYQVPPTFGQALFGVLGIVD